MSIRLREIMDVSQALAEALRITQGPGDRPATAVPRSQPRPAGRPAGPRATLPLSDPEGPPSRFRAGFDEFAGAGE